MTFVLLLARALFEHDLEQCFRVSPGWSLNASPQTGHLRFARSLRAFPRRALAFARFEQALQQKVCDGYAGRNSSLHSPQFFGPNALVVATSVLTHNHGGEEVDARSDEPTMERKYDTNHTGDQQCEIW